MFSFFKPKPIHISLLHQARRSANRANPLQKVKSIPLLQNSTHLVKATGVLTLVMTPTIAMYLLNQTLINQKIIAASAPEHLKDKNDPNRFVIGIDELEAYGEGAGSHGRSNPKKKQHKSTESVGFLKESAEGKNGFFNELIYHRLAEKIFGDLHPKIKIIEKQLEHHQSEYFLYIESIGFNSDLKSYAQQQSNSQNPQDLSSLTIDNLGRAVAFAGLIRSSDSYMKNYVIRTEHYLALYPIDFELIDHDRPMLFVDFSLDPKLATGQLIKKAIMDYQPISALHPNEQRRIRKGGDTEAGTGFKYGEPFYDLLERSCQQDLENGQILEMYQTISGLEDSDINDIVDECAFLMNKEEIAFYKDTLHQLVKATQTYLNESNLTFQPKL
ncbi:MAG: hypothetical protein CK424_06125 [Legionella sp.]|nr:MAG: hypothetical protein CK424_06125 [Legionella sp.]